MGRLVLRALIFLVMNIFCCVQFFLNPGKYTFFQIMKEFTLF